MITDAQGVNKSSKVVMGRAIHSESIETPYSYVVKDSNNYGRYTESLKKPLYFSGFMISHLLYLSFIFPRIKAIHPLSLHLTIVL